MTLHKLAAGSGYTYLTRQVAVQDVTERGFGSLAAYYEAKGESPGSWVGAGLAGVDLQPGDPVSERQMVALFGKGHHPLAAQRVAALATGATRRDRDAAVRLGPEYRVAAEVPEFHRLVADRLAALGESLPLGVSSDGRAVVRTAVARELFVRDVGRAPLDARELSGALARYSRWGSKSVAGYDLTFSPPKSFSALWALAPMRVAELLHRCHTDAVAAALRYVEEQALYSREGHNGVRQVDVTGLIGAAFVHRDSRAADPDLHSHVAVANKVQTLDGKWLAVDGRVLYRAVVTASETYNTVLAGLVAERLGVAMVAVPHRDQSRLPTWEIPGVPDPLLVRWSQRRVAVTGRVAELSAAFLRAHGRPPSKVEAYRLAQQATYETRMAKHEGRSFAEQRATWRGEAAALLGGGGAVDAMVASVLANRGLRTRVDSTWLERTAGEMVAAVEREQATWRTTQLRSVALRLLRGTDVPVAQLGRVADLMVSMAVDRCVPVGEAPADHDMPEQLRRRDGSSAYEVAGARLYTSQVVLAAESALLDAAGQTDGARVPLRLVEGVVQNRRPRLNLGQVEMVRELATSGRRLQLVIAPAGAGKTVAVGALADAWRTEKRSVVGVAPSATAAAELAAATGGVADTVAKLVHGLAHPSSLPTWAAGVGEGSLLIVDEAGMVDTVSLHRLVDWAVGRGAVVRLVGDDQQLAAIGSGGVLRDLAHRHGAVRLTELIRFADPAEAAASLALREGRPEALGFYYDRGRVHVGDLDSLTEQVFTAWRDDVTAGRESLMLAPTHDLVTRLDTLAQTHRITTGQVTQTGLGAGLADGQRAWPGDVVLTRVNRRDLPVSRTDWVKNGDRWSVVAVERDGSLRVQHVRHGRMVRLPATYVAGSVELGYAGTVHTAQGTTVDTIHGILTGAEDRQLLYTMLTRGRLANHAYLDTVGDGTATALVTPEARVPDRPTDLLEQILVRDASATSATTAIRETTSAEQALAEAAARYSDGLVVAVADILGAARVARLEQSLDALVPGIGDQPAWPTLRVRVLTAALDGDPIPGLRAACAGLEEARDPAALLLYRWAPADITAAGPLPWLPGLPARVAADPRWGIWLDGQAKQVRDAAAQVQDHAYRHTPGWWPEGFLPEQRLLDDITIWRAATGVAPSDRRPTGPRLLPIGADGRWQQRLIHRLDQARRPALAEWTPLLTTVEPRLAGDPYLPELCGRLATLARAGLNVPALIQTVTGPARPLPDDHTAAALWWRLTPIAPASAQPTPTGDVWSRRLVAYLGEPIGTLVRGSLWWPATIRLLHQAQQRGWQPEDLVTGFALTDPDPGWTLLTHIGGLVRDTPSDDDEPTRDPHHNDRPADLDQLPPLPVTTQHAIPEATVEPQIDPLATAALWRMLAGRPDPSPALVADREQRTLVRATSPVPVDRIAELNRLAADYYQTRFAGSWSQDYLQERFGRDLTGDPRFQPGHAPAGWTHLVDHLHRLGATNQELLAAGLATTSSRGTLIDRFRDRAIFPILDTHGRVLGFVGRRHPDAHDDQTAGPKYLNTATTPLYAKGAHLYGAPGLAAGTVPVLVEGPIDAIAVTLTGNGHYAGVAPLGTALTEEQARHLADAGSVIVAFDHDPPGRAAADRAYWILTGQRLDPLKATLPIGADPADLLTRAGPGALLDVLLGAGRLGDHVLAHRTDLLVGTAAATAAAATIAAGPSNAWEDQLDQAALRLDLDPLELRTAVAVAANRLSTHPHESVDHAVREAARLHRLQATAAGRDLRRATEAACEILVPGLTRDPAWPTLEHTLVAARAAGHDPVATVHLLAELGGLGSRPATALSNRLRAALQLRTDASAVGSSTPPNLARHTGTSESILAPDLRLSR